MFREERSRAMCIFLKPRSYLHIKKGKFLDMSPPALLARGIFAFPGQRSNSERRKRSDDARGRRCEYCSGHHPFGGVALASSSSSSSSLQNWNRTPPSRGTVGVVVEKKKKKKRALSASFSSRALTASDWRDDENEGNVWLTLGKPTLMKIISSVAVLGVPSLLSVLCEPAIGCTESLLVGRVGALYLAAIAPSSVMFWLIEEVCFALSVGVTTAVSEASAARSLISLDELEEDDEGASRRRPQGNKEFKVTEETREIVQASVLAAFGLGIAFALMMQFMYAPAMRILGVSGEALKLGRLYTAIRCFGLPFFAIGVTFEGAYMGERDAMTPLCAFGLAMLATVIFQVALIHPAYGGLASVIGAGTAMSIGQLVAAGFLLVSANKQGFFNISQTIRRSSRDLPKLLRKTISLLNKSDVTDSTVWLFCGSASRMLVYTLCTALATQMGVIPAASNKYALDIYFFVCYLIEPLFTLGTVLLPKKLKTNKIEAGWMRRILFCLAILAALILCCLASVSISAAGYFNLIEPELVKSLNAVKPYVVASVGVSSFAYAVDGIRIGMGGAKYVGQMQLFNLLLTAGLAAWMKKLGGMTLNHVWVLMVSFQFLRVCQHVYVSVKSDRELLMEEER
jgi:Na+-driven multidrug efflux pump